MATLRAVELSASESSSDVENGLLTGEADVHSSRLFRTTKVALASVLGIAALTALGQVAHLSKVSVPGVQQLDNLSGAAVGTWFTDGKFDTGPRAAVDAAPLAGAEQEHRHDGNNCQDDEEEHDGLCYKQCTLLTKGVAKKRCSAFSCSKTEKCHLPDEIVKLAVPCNGFDVAGNINGETSACPHSEGTCLQDEELYMDTCYKKCAELTAQWKIVHNYRSAAATCCEAGAMCAWHFKTEAAFEVGGAGAPGGMPHPPMKILTEEAPTPGGTI